MLQLITKIINPLITFSRNKARTILVLILYVVNVSRSSQQRTLFVFSSQTILSCHPTLCFCEFFLLTVRLSSSKTEKKKQETRVKRKRSKEFYCLAFQNMQDLTITIIKLEKLEMHKLLFQKTKQDQFWC